MTLDFWVGTVEYGALRHVGGGADFGGWQNVDIGRREAKTFHGTRGAENAREIQ